MSDQVYSTGRRKESVAKVWVSNGTGNITINKKNFEDYFPDKALRMIINQPLEAAKKTDSVDLKITVLGGGLSGQAGAIKHGLSRALTLIDPNTKDTLKKKFWEPIFENTDFKEFVKTYYSIGHRPMVDIDLDIDTEE